MKRSNYPTLMMMALMLSTMIISAPAFSQTTYSINSTGKWSSSIPATCNTCTINIASAATLTIDETVTCQNCTFQGGAMTITNHTLNLQYSGTVTTTNFVGTALTVAATSGKMTVNAPLSLNNSTITFSGSSSITTSYELDLTASTIYLNDKSTMTANGSLGTPLKLMQSSRIVVGDGQSSSTATLSVSGPLVEVYDNSFLAVSNTNNGYYNWLGYMYYATTASSTPTYHNTLNNQLNCGAGYTKSCAMNAAFGPSTLSSGGLVSGITLPVVLDDFNAAIGSDNTVALTWKTQMETNSAHFTIERSVDGETWETIGMVRAQGNSAVASDYSFTDERPAGGTNFYRLQMVDLDNSFTYSEVKVVRTSVIGQISFYPNPARDYVNVSLGNGNAGAGTATVRLISLAGQVMQQQRIAQAPGAVVSFRVSNYPAGIYILSVVAADGSRDSRQMVISK
ncbi:MAG TPA: T9SS type A sorting domain-containing protein [Puia sp.]|nr:T9SS type A sorting domain-containing protein [Puia sp.]